MEAPESDQAITTQQIVDTAQHSEKDLFDAYQLDTCCQVWQGNQIYQENRFQFAHQLHVTIFYRQYREQFRYSGTLISQNFVLTCNLSIRHEEFLCRQDCITIQIRIGEALRKFTLQSYYFPATNQEDYGLLKLSQKAKIKEFIRFKDCASLDMKSDVSMLFMHADQMQNRKENQGMKLEKRQLEMISAINKDKTKMLHKILVSNESIGASILQKIEQRQFIVGIHQGRATPNTSTKLKQLSSAFLLTKDIITALRQHADNLDGELVQRMLISNQTLELSADQWNQKGKTFQQQKYNISATKCYLKALQVDPKTGVPTQNLKPLFDKLSSTQKKTIRKYVQTKILKHNKGIGYYLLGLVCCYEKQLEKAAQCFKRVIEINPQNVFGFVALSYLQRLNKNRQEAIRLCLLSIQIDPLYFLGYANLANTLNYSGRKQEAIPYYLKAKELKPDQPAIHYHLGYALFCTSKHQDAIASYLLALNLKPDYSVVFYQLAKAYQATNQIRFAIEYLQKYISSGLSPNQEIVAQQKLQYLKNLK